MAKSKIYGGRYRTIESLGSGGQAEVFRVEDEQDPSKPQFALKRLRNVERLGRFRSEIEALQRIDHPNVIKILDHSGEAAAGDTEHKYWFLMPLAMDNLEKRIGIYKGNLDGVLEVAIRLADALVAAHKRNIVHRDVKPANILFAKLDHDVWLSDFGICHLGSEQTRHTETNEVVGPRMFLAPELEVGGRTTLTGAADIYSLGKVIFYMLSGGKIIAREQTDTPEFAAALNGGERHRLLQLLLIRMIAPLTQRLQDMGKVLEELQRIRDWEKQTKEFALADDALAAITGAKEESLERQRITQQNTELRNAQNQAAGLVCLDVVQWLKRELARAAELLNESGTIKSEVEDAWQLDECKILLPTSQCYKAVAGVQLAFVDETVLGRPKFVLRFFLCQLLTATIQLGSAVKPLKPSDPQFAIMPHLVELQGPEYKKWHMGGYLRDSEVMKAAATAAATRQGHGRFYVQQSSQPLIAKSYMGKPMNIMLEFKASEWPAVADQLKTIFSKSVKLAIDYSRQDNRSCGG